MTHFLLYHAWPAVASVKQFWMSVATRTPVASNTSCCRKPVLFYRVVGLDFSFTLNEPVLCPDSVQMHVNLHENSPKTSELSWVCAHPYIPFFFFDGLGPLDCSHSKFWNYESHRHLDGVQHIARPLPTHDNTNTQKCRHTSMPWVAFETTSQLLERAKTFHALNGSATMMTHMFLYNFVCFSSKLVNVFALTKENVLWSLINRFYDIHSVK
jgi:hypothetical protein